MMRHISYSEKLTQAGMVGIVFHVLPVASTHELNDMHIRIYAWICDQKYWKCPQSALFEPSLT